MKTLTRLIIALLFFQLGTVATAEEKSVSSGPLKNAILELYTSEGCSSCPPAEAWLSQLGESEEYPASELIPLAFYVDYWDYLGWKDRYAQADFSMRQKMHQINGAIRSLYTPQLILDSKELRPAKNLPIRFQQIRSSKASLQLDISIRKKPKVWQVTLKSKPLETLLASKQSLYLAVTENNIISNISAGENHGKTLKHDHVVREFIGPIDINVSKESSITKAINLSQEWNLEELSVVAFVQTMQGEILQAVRWGSQ